MSNGRRSVFSYFVPLILSAVFFALLILLNYYDRALHGHEATRLLLFGKDDVRLHFIAWVALIIFVVRVVDAFIFDVASNSGFYRMKIGPATFSQLSSSGSGYMTYCSDCTNGGTQGATCSGSGNGALAIRLNGAWKCFGL